MPRRRSGKPDDDRPEDPRPPAGDLVEALSRLRAEAAEGRVSVAEYRRRAAAAIAAASDEEVAAATSELSSALGAAPADDARNAAVERLTELRAAGAITEEQFAREKQRLLGYG